VELHAPTAINVGQDEGALVGSEQALQLAARGPVPGAGRRMFKRREQQPLRLRNGGAVTRGEDYRLRHVVSLGAE
jgi:hypothetical protein